MTNTTPTISLAMLNRIANIDEFKGRWESLGQLVTHRLKALQRIANVESTAAIARMKGAKYSDRQIGEFLNGHNTPNNLSLEEQDGINGFHVVLKLVNDSYEQIPFIENHVLQIHGLLANKGKPDTVNNTGVSKELSSLIEHVGSSIEDGHLHPILILSDFSFRFWHLRPFQQGNNRLTWLLGQLLLLRHGYSFLPYGSIVRFMEKRLADYQKTLFFTKDSKIVNANPDSETWLNMLLDAMTDLQENIVAKINREKKLLRLPDPHLEIIRIIQENGQSTISQIMATTKMNRNTLKVRLRKLVAENYLTQQGCGKSTHYLLPDLHLQ